MTDELCAREGCGAPKAWHSYQTALIELEHGWDYDRRPESHCYTRIPGRDGICIGYDCNCPAYLAPTPPEPEGKAYVVLNVPHVLQDRESDNRLFFYGGGKHYIVPLNEYLAAHPQPVPALCICGGTADEHDPVTGRCQHKTQRMLYSDSGSVIERLRCGCQKFAVQP